MVKHLRRNLVAYIALFAAVGGTSYAAVRLPAGSVGRAQLKRNAVVSAKVRDGSLLAKDFKKGQLRPGPQGPPGPKGAAGTPGADGAPGPSGPGAIRLLKVDKQADGSTTALATVNGFTITDACSVNTQGAITNNLHIASAAPNASVGYRFSSSTDGNPATTAVGNAVQSFGATPTASSGHRQDAWMELVLTDDKQVATASLYVRALDVTEPCRTEGSVVPTG